MKAASAPDLCEPLWAYAARPTAAGPLCKRFCSRTQPEHQLPNLAAQSLGLAARLCRPTAQAP
eukprot:1052763-Amphidinium_carterae.1